MTIHKKSVQEFPDQFFFVYFFLFSKTSPTAAIRNQEIGTRWRKWPSKLECGHNEEKIKKVLQGSLMVFYSTIDNGDPWEK
jgi:hypothetical protein